MRSCIKLGAGELHYLKPYTARYSLLSGVPICLNYRAEDCLPGGEMNETLGCLLTRLDLNEVRF